MGSWVGGSLNSTINLVSKITDYCNTLLSQGKLEELHNVIMESAKKIILEMQNLEKDRLGVNKECIFLQGMNRKYEMERVNYQGELLRVRKECEDLKEKVSRLDEDKRLSDERVKRAEERYSRVCQDQVRAINEKNKILAEKNDLVTLLKNDVMERHNSLGRCKENMTALGVKFIDTQKECEIIKAKKLEGDGLVMELRGKQVEDGLKLEELRRRNVEVLENMDKLKRLMVNVECDNLKSVQELNNMKGRCLELERNVKEVMSRYSEACGVIKELRAKISVVEDEKRSCDVTIEEMGRKKVEADKIVEELGCKYLEARGVIEELRVRVSEVETEKRGRDLTVEEHGRRYSEACGVIKELRGQLCALETEKQSCDLLIEEMKSKQVEADKTVEELGCKYSEASGVIKELKDHLCALEVEKQSCDLLIEEITCKQLEADKTVKELGGKHFEALQIIRELRSLILEVDEVFEVNRSTCDMLPRVKFVEEGLFTVLRLKVENLTNVVVKQGIGVGNSPVLRGKEQISSEQVSQGLQNLGNGDSPSLSLWINEGDREKNSEKSQGSDSMEVIDSNHETSPGHESDNKSDLNASLGERQKISEFPSCSNPFVALFTSVPRKKRTRGSLGNRDSHIPNYRQSKKQTRESTHKRGKSSIKSSSDDITDTGGDDSQRQVRYVDNSVDVSLSGSEDESCSESDINDLIEGLRSKKFKKTGMTAAEMMNDFDSDVQHCMNAVCVLYRQYICHSESSNGSTGGFGHFIGMGGNALAEYLIDKDPQNRLKKFVAEVELERPDAPNMCRRIAMDYCLKLFSIYANGEDPLFRSR